MKSKFLILFFLFYCCKIHAENLTIESKNFSIDKKNEISIFRDQVIIKTNDGYKLFSEYAEYDKKNNKVILKENVTATDNNNNKIDTNFAEYDDNKKILVSKGNTKITTSQNYILRGEEITFDYKNKIIDSKKKAIINDQDGNKIILENFKYEILKSIFRSIGSVEIKDKFTNSYKFSQVYIDTKNKEILGTDAKTFLNNKNFKINEDNKPRIFSNMIKIKNNKTTFKKSVFTLCDYRKDNKCPPWNLQSSKMLHDANKKTIYYDHAVIKVYDIPIFYLPKLSHPDPSVKRRSGFLVPSFSDTKNLGANLSVPYFIALDDDKDFTLTNKFYVSENPLFLGQYRHAFKDSNLILDLGFTEGYKKTSSKKSGGQKSHLFSHFIKNFTGKNGSKNSLAIKTEEVSNDKYLKLYKIETEIIDKDKDFLENSLSFTHENDELFFGLDMYMFETLKSSYNDKYEYILPEISLDKNLFSGQLGILDLSTNFRSHTFDTNRTSNILVNDFDWTIKNDYFKSGLRGKLFSNIRNINYETKNIDKFKSKTSYELFGALGYLLDIDLKKETKKFTTHLFTPKVLFKYAPNHMRKVDNEDRLNVLKLYELNRIDDDNNFEGGMSATIGFDYEIKDKNNNKKFDISIGQIINETENKKMPSSSSLDEKLSDLVGSTEISLNDKINFDYNFALDQNYSDVNFQELGVKLDLDLIKFDVNYLQEKKHIGNQEYINAGLTYSNRDNTQIKLETKRSLVTNSSEFYDLSYEYFNDCLRASLVYRREFYNDSEIEAENSLMFKLTLIPFGELNSPSINK